ncbi:MAG: class I SAM-dependent methyltransferase [Gammaproteobacteria bacterium]|nr:MAG: class I SAM-dependent methyltransferase [Gammaproteobacteria bacterium]
MSAQTTHFGFREVPVEEKHRLVGRVFDTVAGRYDLMNDLMSLGAHRLWKRFAVARTGLRPGQRALDLAAGTCDVTARLHRLTGEEGLVVASDINASMLSIGRDRLLDRGIARGVSFALADAQALPFRDGSFDAVTIAFGLRNVTHQDRALAEMYRVLRPGGTAVILEFSKVVLPLLTRIYDEYSFRVIPCLGEKVTGDRESYQYLVESIRRHPDQETLRAMMERAGLGLNRYYNLSGGIVAVHQGYRL